jgi:hypothetical protein
MDCHRERSEAISDKRDNQTWQKIASLSLAMTVWFVIANEVKRSQTWQNQFSM